MLGGEVPLHDELRALQAPARILKQMSEDRSGVGKGEIGDGSKGLARARPSKHVDFNHPYVVRRGETAAELSSESRVRLDRKDPGTRSSKGACQDAGTGADLDDEVAGRDGSFADELGGEPAATKKMLAKRDP